MAGRGFNLTYPTAAVLIAVRHGHRYGFDVMDATGLPDGTVYPILRRLERRGVLEADWEPDADAHAEGRPPRRYYGLTVRGEAVVQEAADRFPLLVRLFDGASPQGA
jgi:PadR family transcriptional regulator, regulatory protein PadR